MNVFFDRIDVNSYELAPIISYPRQIGSREYSGRLEELQTIGVSSVLQAGNTKIGKFRILGKGGVGLVVAVESKNKTTCALKIRRVDANRNSMEREVKLHRIANSVGVGPSIYKNSENFILMELVDGCNVVRWLNHQSINAEQVRKVIINTLEQCYNLDRANLDHGELNCLDHHLLISKSFNAHIVDFESASINRKTCNVTGATHSLLLTGQVSRQVNKILHFAEQERLVQLLKVYKWNQTRPSFDKIIEMLPR